MAPTREHTLKSELGQAEFHDLLREKMRLAIRLTLTTILEEELTEAIGAGRYQRNPVRRDHRNGTYTRDLVTSVGLIDDLTVPRSRKGYPTQVFDQYHRRQSELDQAIGAMFVAGASQVQVGAVMETLVGQKPSPSTVSRVFHTLEAEFEAWKTRPLAARYLYAFADGTYFSVIYDSQGQKMPILAILGVTPAVNGMCWRSASGTVKTKLPGKRSLNNSSSAVSSRSTSGSRMVTRP